MFLSEKLLGKLLRLLSLLTVTINCAIIYPTASSPGLELTFTITGFVGFPAAAGVFFLVLLLSSVGVILLPAPLKLITFLKRSNQKGSPSVPPNAVISTP